MPFMTRYVLGFVALAAAGCVPPSGSDRLIRPIAPELAPRWLETGGPVRLHGSTWLVGFTHLNVVLIAGSNGSVLIDAGLPQAAPLLEENIRRAGFRVEDIRFILSSEPHYDHAGGIAALARASGATVLASEAGARVLRAGRSGKEDPQRTTLFAYPGVSRVRAVRDDERIRLGDIEITAHATPGHTPGSMSWTWRSCEKPLHGDCVTIAFVSSLNSLTDGHYRYSDTGNAAVVTAFRQTFATVRALPCDILITGHPEHSDGDARLDRLRAAPGGPGYRSPGACRALADRYEAAFDKRLADPGDRRISALPANKARVSRAH